MENKLKINTEMEIKFKNLSNKMKKDHNSFVKEKNT